MNSKEAQSTKLLSSFLMYWNVCTQVCVYDQEDLHLSCFKYMCGVPRHTSVEWEEHSFMTRSHCEVIICFIIFHKQKIPLLTYYNEL